MAIETGFREWLQRRARELNQPERLEAILWDFEVSPAQSHERLERFLDLLAISEPEAPVSA
jgi:hypothetical protein